MTAPTDRPPTPLSRELANASDADLAIVGRALVASHHRHHDAGAHGLAALLGVLGHEVLDELDRRRQVLAELDAELDVPVDRGGLVESIDEAVADAARDGFEPDGPR